MKTNPAIDALLGVAVGDALGVPYEFKTRIDMQLSPAKDMTGYGTHNQPPGTWSDDSSMTFCQAESLVHAGYDLADLSQRFIDWKLRNYWTAHNELFDIGITTSQAISRLAQILDNEEWDMLPMQKNLGDEYENGNGSLMRILPLLFYLKGKDLLTQWRCIWEVSGLTHRHVRAGMACFIYLKFAEHLLDGKKKEEAYRLTRKEVEAFWRILELPNEERKHFRRIIQQDVRNISWKDLRSGGYVIESLEASFWCFLQKDNYEQTVLTAINLGHDTDTTAAIAGGLAGLYYTSNGIPEYWIVSTARMEDITDLGERLYVKYGGS